MAKEQKISRKSRQFRQLPKSSPEYKQKVEWLQDAHARDFAAKFIYPHIEKPSSRQQKIWQRASLKEVNGKPKYRLEFNDAEFAKLEEAKEAYKAFLEEQIKRIENL